MSALERSGIDGDRNFDHQARSDGIGTSRGREAGEGRLGGATDVMLGDGVGWIGSQGDNDDDSATFRAQIERLKSEGRQELPAALNRLYRPCAEDGRYPKCRLAYRVRT